MILNLNTDDIINSLAIYMISEQLFLVFRCSSTDERYTFFVYNQCTNTVATLDSKPGDIFGPGPLLGTCMTIYDYAFRMMLRIWIVIDRDMVCKLNIKCGGHPRTCRTTSSYQ